MRQWLREFFLSGQFLIWLGVLALMMTMLLPETLGDALFAALMLTAIGMFTGWSIVRFLRHALLWGVWRALIDFSTLPLIIIIVSLIAWIFSGLVSWVTGAGSITYGAMEIFVSLAEMLTLLISHPIFLFGLALGGVLPMFGSYRRGRAKRSADYMSAKQQLRQFLNYYLNAWRLRAAKELPFQHDWSANPRDVGKPREDEVRPYLDLLAYRRKWWRWMQALFRRKT